MLILLLASSRERTRSFKQWCDCFCCNSNMYYVYGYRKMDKNFTETACLNSTMNFRHICRTQGRGKQSAPFERA